MQRGRDLEHSTLNGMSLSNSPPPPELREPRGTWGTKNVTTFNFSEAITTTNQQSQVITEYEDDLENHLSWGGRADVF